MSRQYTIRSVPAKVYQALRRRAWQEDPGFDRAMEAFERIDEELWR